jgi:hypothetical protein
MPICGEVYVPSLRRWRLNESVMLEKQCREFSPDDALELVGDADALNAHCPDPADLAPQSSAVHKERLDWLDEAIATTLKEVRTEEQEVTNELPWAHGSSYEFEIDMISWIKAAYRTLERLFEEKQLLVAREAMRRQTKHDD